MADQIYPSGNYLIIHFDGEEPKEWPQDGSTYNESTEDSEFYIVRDDGSESTIGIKFSDATSWQDESAVAYTESTLRTMLRENTRA